MASPGPTVWHISYIWPFLEGGISTGSYCNPHQQKIHEIPYIVKGPMHHQHINSPTSISLFTVGMVSHKHG